MKRHVIKYSNELYHHGILGQKWGVRRYQNKDGSWTNEGKRHRQTFGEKLSTKRYNSNANKYTKSYCGYTKTNIGEYNLSGDTPVSVKKSTIHEAVTSVQRCMNNSLSWINKPFSSGPIGSMSSQLNKRFERLQSECNKTLKDFTVTSVSAATSTGGDTDCYIFSLDSNKTDDSMGVLVFKNGRKTEVGYRRDWQNRIG